jgi:iron complex transport system ATP-binding protein
MVEIKNLSFSYGKTTVVKDVSVSLSKGKLYGIIGPNGCGKSTLLKLISGILKPDTGNILIDNKDIKDINRNNLSLKLGFMPQSRPIPDMTVADYVLCGRFPHRNHKSNTAKKDIEILNYALSITNTTQFADRRITQLSGGERQRVYLALLLAQETETVLCDEPTTYLDIKSNISVMNILTSIKNENKCVVAVLHDLVSTLKFCDEIILMDNGKIIDTGTPESIIKNGNINRVFGVTCKEISTDKGKNYILE